MWPARGQLHAPGLSPPAYENLGLHDDSRAHPFGGSARPLRHRYYFLVIDRYPIGSKDFLALVFMDVHLLLSPFGDDVPPCAAPV